MLPWLQDEKIIVEYVEAFRSQITRYLYVVPAVVLGVLEWVSLLSIPDVPVRRITDDGHLNILRTVDGEGAETVAKLLIWSAATIVDEMGHITILYGGTLEVKTPACVNTGGMTDCKESI